MSQEIQPGILLVKRQAWVRPYNFNFGPFAEIVGGETISGPPTVTVSPATVPPLTWAGPSISPDGTQVQVEMAGGAVGTTYNVNCTVTLTDGITTLSIPGQLLVVS
jgi:hypothetical protein